MPGFPVNPTPKLHEPEAGLKVLPWICSFVLRILGIVRTYSVKDPLSTSGLSLGAVGHVSSPSTSAAEVRGR